MQLQWRQNGRDGVSNHRHLDCLLNRLFGHRSKKSSKLRVTGLCEGNSPLSGEFSTQRVSNGVNVSIRWRHHVGVLANDEQYCHTMDLAVDNPGRKVSWYAVLAICVWWQNSNLSERNFQIQCLAICRNGLQTLCHESFLSACFNPTTGIYLFTFWL